MGSRENSEHNRGKREVFALGRGRQCSSFPSKCPPQSTPPASCVFFPQVLIPPAPGQKTNLELCVSMGREDGVVWGGEQTVEGETRLGWGGGGLGCQEREGGV